MSWNKETYRVAEFSQSQAGKVLETPALRSLADGVGAKSGVCDVLSAKWIRMMIKGKARTPQERMQHLDTATTMRKAIVRHTVETEDHPARALQGQKPTPQTRGELLELLVQTKFALKRTEGKMRVQSLLTVLDGYGLKLVTGALVEKPKANAAKEMGGAAGKCSVVTFTTPRGAHAVACRGGSFFVEFFDPNFGEYRIPAVALSGWFTDLLAHYDVSEAATVKVGQIKPEVVPRAKRAIQWQVGMGNWVTSLQAMNILRSRGEDTLKTPGAVRELSREDIELLVDLLAKREQWNLDKSMKLLKTMTQFERDVWMRAMHLKCGRPAPEVDE